MDYILYNPKTELYHFGILGQKWGIRRFQNKDGTYTSEGLARKRKSDNISRKEVKKVLRDYNTLNGTHHRYNKHTIINKGGKLYDYKGRKLDNKSSIYSNGNKLFGHKRNPLDSKSIEELNDIYQKEKLKNDIGTLSKKNASLGEQFVDDLKRSTMQGVSSGIGQGVTTAIARAISLEADKNADVYKFNKKKAEDAYDDAREAERARREWNEYVRKLSYDYDLDKKKTEDKYNNARRTAEAEDREYRQRKYTDFMTDIAWDKYNDEREREGKTEWDRWNGGTRKKKKKK